MFSDIAQNERPKIGKPRRSYDAEFKQEVIRMLVAGRSVRETSEAFGITENVLYRWRRIATKRQNRIAAKVATIKQLS
ncbi:transposase [Dyadobacter sp. CY261]|uniref:transposase n=1 Tax=Dyadobacter sp. CY261 TaxID=2907203 RepID=UPI0038D38B40